METFIQSCSISNAPFLTFPVQPRRSCFVLQAVICQFDCYGRTFAASHLRVGHYPRTSPGYFADEMDDKLKTGRHSLSEKWRELFMFRVSKEKRRPSSDRCVYRMRLLIFERAKRFQTLISSRWRRTRPLLLTEEHLVCRPAVMTVFRHALHPT